MYAIVEISGQQFKVQKDQQIFVHRLEAKEGSQVDFERVLLMDNSGQVEVGSPVIKDVKVTAKVLEHFKGEKVIVFKKKRRKGYRVKNGHRQYLTKLEIQKIDLKASSLKKEESKKKEKVVKKSTAKKSTAKKSTAKKSTAKKSTVKKSTVKKSTVKKSTVKKSD